uniref:Ribonuclease H-like domain-containing protein n=1 Tax=Tanacetum cinerariifolium TaxID=118510 RepID=A0A6L2LZA9_TANCI|nr:ribonuclease H-like domain-containing protein [Tanacetum cinerariifolium]
MTRDDNHDGDQPETSNPSQPIPPPTSQLLNIVSYIKIPILKKGKYDIWAMRMEHYLCHTDYPIWQVIQNGNGFVSVTTDTNGMIKVLPPKTAEEVVAREKERKARTTLLTALPEHHLAKFHKMTDAKEMWEAIKSRFCGNDESKKMQKYLLKQQFKGFFVSASEGLHKGYDRADTLSFDDLYNNLRVFERDVKGTAASSSSNTQNVAFVLADNTSSNNDVSTAYSVSSPSVSKSQKELSASNTDKVAMISMRIKKFHKRTGRKLQFNTRDTVGFDKTKVECFNCYKIRHFAKDCRAKGNQDSRRRDGGYNENKARDNGRRPAYQDDSKALVTIDGEAIDWSRHIEEDTQNFAMMAYSSSNSGSENEIQSCFKTCTESYARLKKLYDEQKDKLGDASVEIIGYSLALKKSVFMNKECDLENTPVNDRYAEGMHTVPPSMTKNYMPSGPDVEIDYSKFTYGPNRLQLMNQTLNLLNMLLVILNKVFNYNSGSKFRKSVKDPLGRLKSEMAWFPKRNKFLLFLTNGHQFTVSNKHQELASPEANGFCKELASLKQMALEQTAAGKENSNPLMADSITILLTMLAVKLLLFMGSCLRTIKDYSRLGDQKAAKWVSDDELEAPEEAPRFSKQAPLSLNYVLGPEHPPSLDYVHGLEYLEYLVPSNDEVSIEDQPLPTDASPTALSLGYVVESDPSEEDPKEDPREDPADGGDDDNDDDEEEEEEHLAPADSTILPVVDYVPSAEDIEAFKINESAPTLRAPSPRLHRARLSVRPQTPMAAATKALIDAVVAALPSSSPPPPLTMLSSPLLHIPSPPLPLPSPPAHIIPTYAEAPLGYKADMIRSSVASPLLLPAPSSPLLLPANDVRKMFPRLMCHLRRGEVGYRITDVWDDMVRDIEGRASTTLEELSQRVTNLANTLARDTHEMYAQQAWSQAMNCNRALHAELLAYRAEQLHRRVSDQVFYLHSSWKCSNVVEFPVNTVGHDAAYGMSWKTLKKMMTDNYYLRGEIKKLEIKLLNLKVNESDEVEKYVGGLPDMIQGNVMASKPKTM